MSSRSWFERRVHGASAQRRFTDRIEQIEATGRSLAEVTRLGVQGPEALLRPGLPRRNVLTFYGMGGMGKTRLVQELSRRFAEREPALGPSDAKRASAFFDLERIEGWTLDEVVLAIRASFGSIQRRWRPFDLAFANYWERAPR